MLCNSLLEKQPSPPDGVSSVQWWILTEYTEGMAKYKLDVGNVRATELKPTDSQISSNTPEKSRDNVDEGQGVSSSSEEMQSEKTSSEINEGVAQCENVGKYNNCSKLEMCSVSTNGERASPVIALSQ